MGGARADRRVKRRDSFSDVEEGGFFSRGRGSCWPLGPARLLSAATSRWSQGRANGFKGIGRQLPRPGASAGMRGRREFARLGTRVAPMPAQLAHTPAPDIRVRKAERGDLDALVALEQRVFATDRLSRRSLERFLSSPTAEVIVAYEDGALAGTAIVLFRAGSTVARLYSIAVAPHQGGSGVAQLLLAAAEAASAKRDCRVIRLEVHVTNHPAIGRYRKSGYREFARLRAYYEDGGDALRFEKRLVPNAAALTAAPPYFHQTSEFTCGPACIMMALAWANRSFKPAPVLEFELWRQATIICGGSGPGGCEPYGMAVTCRRH